MFWSLGPLLLSLKPPPSHLEQEMLFAVLTAFAAQTAQPVQAHVLVPKPVAPKAQVEAVAAA